MLGQLSKVFKKKVLNDVDKLLEFAACASQILQRKIDQANIACRTISLQRFHERP